MGRDVREGRRVEMLGNGGDGDATRRAAVRACDRSVLL